MSEWSFSWYLDAGILAVRKNEVKTAGAWFIVDKNSIVNRDTSRW